jgi:hypothetical protein
LEPTATDTDAHTATGRLRAAVPALADMYLASLGRAALARLPASSSETHDDLCLSLTEGLVPIARLEGAAALLSDTGGGELVIRPTTGRRLRR